MDQSELNCQPRLAEILITFHTFSYVAIFEGKTPLNKTKLAFTKGCVREVPPKGILPWKDSRYLIDDTRKVIMLYEAFKTPSELTLMMSRPKQYIRQPLE